MSTKSKPNTMKFELRSRWTGDVQIVAEIEADNETPIGRKIGLAVKWALNNDTDLTGADLSGADLFSANLSNVDLAGANLARVNLASANLCNANLYGVNLCGASLSRVNLSRANLDGANLSRADISGSNLIGANLSRANLSNADLCAANLSGVNLASANLSRANLHGANLNGANLFAVNLCSVKKAEQVIDSTRILPEGDLIGWKKCADGVIVKLRIPESAKRSHAFGRKCRAEFVDVLEVIGATKGISAHDDKTEYAPGQRVTPDSFDEDWRHECAGGIHFFITRREAEAY